MTKFYKNTKTGAVITEKEYEEKAINSETEMSTGLGSMSIGGYTSFVTDVLDGEIDDYSNYVPYEPEEEK